MAEKHRSDINKVSRESEPGATGEADCQESAETRARREARRRFLTGGIATAPLIVTLTSRPALATGGSYWGGGGCGPSSMLSGNLSNNTEPQGCEGKTPGYWKTHFKYWPDEIEVGPCNPISKSEWGRWGICEDYSVPSRSELETYLAELKENSAGSWHDERKIQKVETYLHWLDYYYPGPPFGTPFAQIFGVGLTADPELTMMQALWLDDTASSGGSAPVLAHCVAAYLNASHFGKSRYGMSPQEAVELVSSMLPSNPEGLKDILEVMNSRSHG